MRPRSRCSTRLPGAGPRIFAAPEPIFLALDFSPDGTRIAAAHGEHPDVRIRRRRGAARDNGLGSFRRSPRGGFYARTACGWHPVGTTRPSACGTRAPTRRSPYSAATPAASRASHSARREMAGLGGDRWHRPDLEGSDPAAGLTLHGHTAGVTQVAYQRPWRTIASTSCGWLCPALGCDDAGRRLRASRPQELRLPGGVLSSRSLDRLGCVGPNHPPLGCIQRAPGSHARGSHQTIGALAFTPDGARLASWAEDQTIRIWDASTGNTITS